MAAMAAVFHYIGNLFAPTQYDQMSRAQLLDLVQHQDELLQTKVRVERRLERMEHQLQQKQQLLIDSEKAKECWRKKLISTEQENLKLDQQNYHLQWEVSSARSMVDPMYKRNDVLGKEVKELRAAVKALEQRVRPHTIGYVAEKMELEHAMMIRESAIAEQRLKWNSERVGLEDQLKACKSKVAAEKERYEVLLQEKDLEMEKLKVNIDELEAQLAELSTD